MAREVSTDLIVGAGSCTPVRDGVTEVAAIGVVATHRRLGIAGALARRLAPEACVACARVPWLMAAGEGERCVYERAGLGAIGEILHPGIPERLPTVSSA